MSKENLSLAIQIFALLITIVFTARYRKYIESFIVATVLMVLANIIGQIIIAGGGPGAFIGMFWLPIVGIFFAWLTIIIANFITFCWYKFRKHS